MKTSSLAIAAILALSTNAQAYDRNTVTVGLGISDIFEENLKEPVANLEWRGKAMAPTSAAGLSQLSPIAGVSTTTEWATMLYAGVGYDWNFYDAWSLFPSFAAGLHIDGKGKEMGSALEFRSSIEVNYKLDESQRVGVNLAHISNFGIGDENPGKEDLTFNYSFAY